MRGEVAGWSSRSVQANTRFLYAVDFPALTGEGVSFTLTVRDCPTQPEWRRCVLSFCKRLDRLGMLRGHWLIEWQARGVPHLHGCAWFPESVDSATIKRCWLEVAASYRPHSRGQDVAPLRDAFAWANYLSKHASRGLGHYQRCPENIPATWEKTGRMWGKRGEWPIAPTQQFGIDDRGYWRFRRWVRAWRTASCRQRPMTRKSVRRLVSARRMLRCPNPELSAVRGVSEWIPADLALLFLQHLVVEGHVIHPT